MGQFEDAGRLLEACRRRRPDDAAVWRAWLAWGRAADEPEEVWRAIEHLKTTDLEPAELPADASVAPAWLHAVHSALPSTVGVSLLAAVALAFQPTLTALLGGILVGLGLVALLRAYGMDGALYFDPRTRTVFRK